MTSACCFGEIIMLARPRREGFSIFIFVLLLPLLIPFVLIVGSVAILITSFKAVFKRVLYFVDDKSFQLSVLVMTTLVGYYQIPTIPFYIYVSIFSALVVLKWLRGSECGILKDRVCYLMYLLNLQWMFRNFSVLGIKLHGCHPVSKIVFQNTDFLIHEGTRIVNPNIGWSNVGVWVPNQPDRNIWRPMQGNVPPAGNDMDVELLDREIFHVPPHCRRLQRIDFRVDKGPMDGGHEHSYRVYMMHGEGLLRYCVHYIETSKNSAGENVDSNRGCTDDFIIEMSEDQVKIFHFYVDMLRTRNCPLISALDDMCHCESMLDVAKLIVKDVVFHHGSFPNSRTFC
ncbi:hypothetical protein KC19_12G013700 [Ceratodon purpureus]|uniref:Uncharacterized protein n=1 Tax=Ceratodon purpureus TaxID=3225 RepID=A0A8T0G2C3_CERPU|nr:hypothetical protein KC19_12G013700 [Ceratodon purpureus]